MSTYSPGRRRFVQLMGWAGVATIARGGPALGQAAARSRATAKPEKPHPVTLPAAVDTTSAAKKGPSEEAKALAEAFRRRYPDRVTDEELASITKDFDGDLQGIAALRKSRLANSDEPDVTFHA